MDEYEKNAADIEAAFEAIKNREPDLEKESKEMRDLENEEDVENVTCFPTENDLETDEEPDHSSLPLGRDKDSTTENNLAYNCAVRSLNDEQRQIFWFFHQWCLMKRINEDTPPLHVGIIGGAGTGKSYVIYVLDNLFKRMLKVHGDEEEDVCQKMSFTGMAAANIDGRTFHSFYGLHGYGVDGAFTESSKASARDRLKAIKVIIEDEISLQSSYMDTKANDHWNSAFQVPSHLKDTILYNNVSVIKVGDFMQLRLFGTPLYENESSKKNPYESLSENRWKKHFKCFELKQCMRQQGDDEFIKILNTVRFMNVRSINDLLYLNEDENKALEYLRSRDIRPEHKDFPQDALHIFPTNQDVNDYNATKVAELVDSVTLKPIDSKMDETGSFSVAESQIAKEDRGLPNQLVIGVGAKVMITKNHDVADKLVNGTLGVVTGFSKGLNGKIKTIWIKPDDNSVGKSKISTLTSAQRGAFPNSIPIARKEDRITIAKNSSFKRLQFPLKLAYAATIHKYQGRSLDTIVIGGFDKARGWKEGMFYTALTRCKRAEGVFLPGFQPLCIKVNESGRNEIERIRRESLLHVEHPRLNFFNKYPATEWSFISYQNVRSLKFHLEDVIADPIISSSDVIAFSETWLDDGNWNGFQKFQSHQVFHQARRDSYLTSERNERRSGGVAVLVRKDIEAAQIHSNDFDDTEIITTRVKLSNQNVAEDAVCSVLYRDHKDSFNTYKSRLSNVFKTLKVSKSLVFGDFNTDMLQSMDCQILAKSHGFHPLIEVPTTINNTLLDNVFVNFDSRLAVEVIPAYFSDHHLIVICMKK